MNKATCTIRFVSDIDLARFGVKLKDLLVANGISEATIEIDAGPCPEEPDGDEMKAIVDALCEEDLPGDIKKMLHLQYLDARYGDQEDRAKLWKLVELLQGVVSLEKHVKTVEAELLGEFEDDDYGEEFEEDDEVSECNSILATIEEFLRR